MAYGVLNYALYQANYVHSAEDQMQASEYRHRVRQMHSLITLVIIGPEIALETAQFLKTDRGSLPLFIALPYITSLVARIRSGLYHGAVLRHGTLSQSPA